MELESEYRRRQPIGLIPTAAAQYTNLKPIVNATATFFTDSIAEQKTYVRLNMNPIPTVFIVKPHYCMRGTPCICQHIRQNARTYSEPRT
jgi:hypothetical protein